MTEEEAYGNMNLNRRISTWYRTGDKVTVGPVYHGNGEYVSDGYVGPYTVVKKLDAAGDYKVCRGDTVDDWDLIINASRLTPRQ